MRLILISVLFYELVLLAHGGLKTDKEQDPLREIGVDYHATTADFANSAFLTRYHLPEVRSVVKMQLAGMKSAGATVISTRIWLVSDNPDKNYQHHFPITSQEIENIKAYANDVAAINVKLYIVFLYLWCAEYEVGSPSTTLGHCGLTAPTFVSYVEKSVAGVFEGIKNIRLPNGKPVVERMFLDGEVMTAVDDKDYASQWEKKNQRWFLWQSGLWTKFYNSIKTAGIIPSLYFIHGNSEADILDERFVDQYLPQLNRHRSMFWIYRTLYFLKKNGLPMPDRVDFSSYVEPKKTSYSLLFGRVMSDHEAVIPSLYGKAQMDMFIAETYYFTDEATRKLAHQGISSNYAKHPSLKGVTIWTTPDSGGQGKHAGYPFDLRYLLVA